MKNLVSLSKNWVITLQQNKYFNNSLVHSFCASWLIALGAYITVPFYPVPMTMQTFVIALWALCTPWPTAISAVLLYLGYALVGLPVLAGGTGGILVCLGPSLGYLLGFILMSGTIALLIQQYQPKGVMMHFIFTLIGGLLLFATGLSRLAHLFSWEIAFKTGLLPFIFSEPTKFALAAYLASWIRRQ